MPVPPSPAATEGHRAKSYGHDLTSDAPVSPGQLSWDILDPCPAHMHVFPCRLL